MKKKEIQNKKEIWHALSEFYLDTELDDYDFKRIALEIYNSKFTLNDVKEINKYEVFPILVYNLLSVAGV